MLKLITIVCLTIISINATHATNVKQNVLLLLADDAGFEMGAYLNKYCQTPNLNKLAKNGLLFNNAFTSVSSCSPSRAQILTGQPSHQNGMYGLHQGIHNFNVFNSVNSLPNILNQNNILTGLIGKKNIGTKQNFHFEYEETEENHSINQIGRNITNMKKYVHEFLQLHQQNDSRNFFLQVSFHDPHRCGHITPQYGEFCELFGNGDKDMGTIPDWQPIYYDWKNLMNIPSYLPDTEAVRKELAAQYMTISRLDQGIGLIINELNKFHLLNNTMIIYTSDNGPPYPNGRTNFYDYGIREPMIIYSPLKNHRHNDVTSEMVSLLDIFPTIIDYFNITLNDHSIKYTGKSLMPLLMHEPTNNLTATEFIYGSQNFHEITMNYPMRMIRSKRYKLIHNLNYLSYFPIDQDLYTSATFQDLLNQTKSNQNDILWYKNLKNYYKRDEWELFDLKMDSIEKWNLYNKIKYVNVRNLLQMKLNQWLIDTNDPWRCAPHSVLEQTGYYKDQPQCLTLGHEFIHF